MPSPQYLPPNPRVSLEYLSTAHPLYCVRYLCGGIRRYGLYKKMYVILICSYLYEIYLISLLYIHTYLFQGFFYFFREYFFSDTLPGKLIDILVMTCCVISWYALCPSLHLIWLTLRPIGSERNYRVLWRRIPRATWNRIHSEIFNGEVRCWTWAWMMGT